MRPLGFNLNRRICNRLVYPSNNNNNHNFTNEKYFFDRRMRVIAKKQYKIKNC